VPGGRRSWTISVVACDSSVAVPDASALSLAARFSAGPK
jgi:hypothetical protein